MPEIACTNCGWTGTADDLQIRQECEDVTPERVCPDCRLPSSLMPFSEYMEQFKDGESEIELA